MFNLRSALRHSPRYGGGSFRPLYVAPCLPNVGSKAIHLPVRWPSQRPYLNWGLTRRPTGRGSSEPSWLRYVSLYLLLTLKKPRGYNNPPVIYFATRADFPPRYYCTGAEYNTAVITRLRIRITFFRGLQHRCWKPVSSFTRRAFTIYYPFWPQSFLTKLTPAKFTYKKVAQPHFNH